MQGELGERRLCLVAMIPALWSCGSDAAAGHVGSDAARHTSGDALVRVQSCDELEQPAVGSRLERASTDDCRVSPTAGQSDLDGDGVPDSIDPDVDGDAVRNDQDNCVCSANDHQTDMDSDGRGDACDERTCYVVDYEAGLCVDPSSTFAVVLVAFPRPSAGHSVATPIGLGLATNRPHMPYRWSLSVEASPPGSRPQLSDATGLGLPHNGFFPQLPCVETNEGGECRKYGDTSLLPDLLGVYVVAATVDLGGVQEQAVTRLCIAVSETNVGRGID